MNHKLFYINQYLHILVESWVLDMNVQFEKFVNILPIFLLFSYFYSINWKFVISYIHIN